MANPTFLLDAVTGSGGGGTPVTTTSQTIRSRKYGTTFEAAGLNRNATVSAAHGLEAVPDGWEGYMECTSPDKSYAVGDRVQWKPPPWRQTVRFDETTTYVYLKNTGWGIISKGSTTGDSSNIDLADWKLVIRPYVYEETEVVTDVSGDGQAGTTALSALKTIHQLPALGPTNFEWVWNLNGILTQNVAETLTTSTLAITYERVASGSTVNLSGHANVRYRGAHYGSAAVANPQNNDIFLNLLDGTIWYYIHVAADELQDGWHPATQALLDAMGYLGYRSSKARADQLVAHASQANKVGLYVGYGGYLRRVTAAVEETEGHTVYHPQEYVPHTPYPGSIIVDEEEFFTTAEIANPALANSAPRGDPLVPTAAGTLTSRGTALGFARAAASPFNLTYEREANVPQVVGVLIRGYTGAVAGGMDAVLWFGNAAELSDGTAAFIASDVKVAAGRYLRVRGDTRKSAGDSVDIRIYGGDTPVALAVTLRFYAIILVQ